MSPLIYLPPANEFFCEGYVFTGVCLWSLQRCLSRGQGCLSRGSLSEGGGCYVRTVRILLECILVSIMPKKQHKGLFTPSKSQRESEKDQRTIGRDQKIKRQMSKKIFAFAWCGRALRLHWTRFWWLLYMAGDGFRYGLGFLSYTEIGSRNPSPSLCNGNMFCIVQCSHWVWNPNPNPYLSPSPSM